MFHRRALLPLLLLPIALLGAHGLGLRLAWESPSPRWDAAREDREYGPLPEGCTAIMVGRRPRRTVR